jgi:hypothetical protein
MFGLPDDFFTYVQTLFISDQFPPLEDLDQSRVSNRSFGKKCPKRWRKYRSKSRVSRGPKPWKSHFSGILGLPRGRSTKKVVFHVFQWKQPISPLFLSFSWKQPIFPVFGVFGGLGPLRIDPSQTKDFETPGNPGFRTPQNRPLPNRGFWDPWK